MGIIAQTFMMYEHYSSQFFSYAIFDVLPNSILLYIYGPILASIS